MTSNDGIGSCFKKTSNVRFIFSVGDTTQVVCNWERKTKMIILNITFSVDVIVSNRGLCAQCHVRAWPIYCLL